MSSETRLRVTGLLLLVISAGSVTYHLSVDPRGFPGVGLIFGAIGAVVYYFGEEDNL